MYCEIHERPKDMDCGICGKPLCKECAEYVEGAWLCHACAQKERHAVLTFFDLQRRDVVPVGDSSHGDPED